MKAVIALRSTGLVVIALFIFPCQAIALYHISDEVAALNLSGSFNAGLGLALYPEDNFLYDEEQETLWNGDFRMVADGYYGENLRGEINILQNYRSTPALSLTGGSNTQLDVERSGLFFWDQHESENTQASLVLDAGQLAYGNSFNELVLGRQPISLSVTFYFTPNDFFAPFPRKIFTGSTNPVLMRSGSNDSLQTFRSCLLSECWGMTGTLDPTAAGAGRLTGNGPRCLVAI